MNFQNYLYQKKEVYIIILELLENEYCVDECNENLDNIIQSTKLLENREELREFLYLILKLSNNYQRNPNFFNKIEYIILYFKDEIKQTFSNYEIFNLFKNNKRVLVFLFEEKIIIPDEYIIQKILEKNDKNDMKYCHFFYNEIKPFINENKKNEIENDLLKYGPNIFSNFDEKRKIGENDSYICTLIRNDSVKDFISHVNKLNIPLSSTIIPSLFETNSFLIKNKETSLIEYSAFFGSIQIFQYLRLSNVELKPSLWLYAIHSKNAELIHLLEENNVEPPNKNFEKCLEESIKCHHNDIANYIIDNLIKEVDKNYNIENKYDQNVVSYCFHYYNFAYFSNDFIKNKFVFHYACQYNYINLIKLLVNMEEVDLNAKVVLILKIL